MSFCAECISDKSEHLPLRRVGRFLLCASCEAVFGERTRIRETAEIREVSVAVRADAAPDLSHFIRRLAPGEVLKEARSSTMGGIGSAQGTFGMTGIPANPWRY